MLPPLIRAAVIHIDWKMERSIFRKIVMENRKSSSHCLPVLAINWHVMNLTHEYTSNCQDLVRSNIADKWPACKIWANQKARNSTSDSYLQCN